MARIKDDFVDKIIEGSKDVEKCFYTSIEEIDYGEAIDKIIYNSKLSDIYTQEQIKILEDEYAKRNNVGAECAKRIFEDADALILPYGGNDCPPIGIEVHSVVEEYIPGEDEPKYYPVVVARDYFTDEQQEKLTEVYDNLRKRYEYLEPVVKKYGNIVHNYSCCQDSIKFHNEILNGPMPDWQKDEIKLEIKEEKTRIKEYEEKYLKQGIDLTKIIDIPSFYGVFKELSRQEDANKMKNKEVLQHALDKAFSSFGNGEAPKIVSQSQKLSM